MNSSSLLNRVKILLYSSLTSVLSGMNRFRTHIQQEVTSSSQDAPDHESVSRPHILQMKGRSITRIWTTVEQILLSLLLWAILGFAAGFLVGMLKPG